MKYTDRKQMMEGMDPEGLAGAPGKDAVKADNYFRYFVLQLLWSIADSMDSMAYAYKEMLEIQRGREKRTPKPEGNNRG